MFSTSSRKNAMLGLFVGAAKAESAAWNFPRLAKCRRIKLLRDRDGTCHANKLQFYGADTQLLFASSQAILNSGGMFTDFRRSFGRRLRYLPKGLPSGLSLAVRWASLKSWLSLLISSGCRSSENSCLLRALGISLAFHGTGHSLQSWISKTTSMSHHHPAAIESCQAVATLVRLAARAQRSGFRPIEAARAMSAAWTEGNRASHEAICEALEHRRSPRVVAKSLGWTKGRTNAVVTAQLASYCFLRYPSDYWRAVNSALALGGDSVTLCALVGGLSGAHLGFEELPKRVRDAKFIPPHGVGWMTELSDRLSIWPHGVEDLNVAPALNSWPLMQLLRNTLILGVRLFRGLLRLPLRLIGS